MTPDEHPAVAASEPTMAFELDRLVSYDDDAVRTEMRRVAALIDAPLITKAAFDRHGRVSSSTCQKRFGGWRQALEAIGEGHRYGGPDVTQKMTEQGARKLDEAAMAAELGRVARALGKTTLTRQEIDQHSNVLGWTAAVSRFGSWKAALEAAGLTTVPHARRWSNDDYFTNLLTVWTHHGRAPRYAELNQPPSTITNGSYAKKFGSWGAAKTAFLERVNGDLADDQPEPAAPPSGTPLTRAARPAPADQRSVRLGLRYTVLRRDHFRCSHCGRSPAAHPGCVLHVDHVHPFARGGKTVLENLRTLCDDCNLGKGSTVEPDAEDASSAS